MTDPHVSPAAARLTFDDRLPLAWHGLDAAPDAAELAHVRGANEDVMRTLASLDEHPQEITDEHPAVTHELRRLDFKLNLLLDLMGMVLTRHAALPDAVTMRLGAGGVVWDTPVAPPTGQLLRLEVYLSARYPRPLTLFGRVRDARPLASGLARVEVAFEYLSEQETDGLEKIVFVHHRRQVAQSRRAPRPG
jgi:hypothetical protein